ncbi:unnamed protein product [Cuscuta campestris]|uniref:CCHC-type domain-containing protein n=1 Tax=Cuscuta campestris TaxID=132261 RepID=A0A484L9L8_9ASTE|nr:unnamed protein product [Cuscuta campestris]
MGDMEEGASVSRPPLLRCHNYNFWKGRMRAFLKSQGGGVWRTVETGWTEPIKYSDDLTTSTIKKFEDYSRAEVLAAEHNDKALNAIFGAVDATQYRLISNCISAKEAWDILEVTHEGDEKVKIAKYQILMTQYENLRMDEKEIIVEFHGRVRDLANQAARLQELFPESKLVLKVLKSLPERFDMDVKAISQSHDAKKMTLDALMGNLEIIESNMKEDSKRRKPEKQIAFLGTDLEGDSEDVLAFDEEFQEQLSLFTKQFKKKWIQKKGKNPIQEGPSKTSTFRESRFKEGKSYDNSSKYKGPLCFECGGHGHIQTECTNNLKKKRQAFSITWSDEDTDEDQGCEESICAFISQSESDDLVEQHMDLQEKWTELLMVNRRNIAEKNQLTFDLKVLKQNLEKAETDNADLKFELQKLKDYIKWMKIAGAEVLDAQELLFKAPRDRQGIGCDSNTKTNNPLEEDSVKIAKNIRNSYYRAVKPIRSYTTGKSSTPPLLSDDDGLYLSILQPSEVLRLEYTPINPEESTKNPLTQRGESVKKKFWKKFLRKKNLLLHAQQFPFKIRRAILEEEKLKGETTLDLPDGDAICSKKNKNGLPCPLLIYSILKDQGFEKEENEEEETIPPLLQVDARHFEGSHFNDMAAAGASLATTSNPASVDYQLSFLEKEIKSLQINANYHHEIAQGSTERMNVLIQIAHTLRQTRNAQSKGESLAKQKAVAAHSCTDEDFLEDSAGETSSSESAGASQESSDGASSDE